MTLSQSNDTMAPMDRHTALTQLTERILSLPTKGPALRVGIDGPDAAGKSTLAGELAALLQAAGGPVIRSSVDQFHLPKKIRYTRGDLSPTGYYADSFDLSALKAALLEPLGPGGSGKYRTACFDYLTDRPVEMPEMTALPGSILLFDGVFLLREELIGLFDFTIFVQVSFDTVLRRAEKRDSTYIGSAKDVRTRYLTRYLPAQQIYLSSRRPDLAVDAVLVNDDPNQVELTFRD
jgi:uridine kinase